MAISKRPRVVVIGSGFGGLWAARALANTNTEVFLIDRNNYHTFLALLYQVGAAELEAEDIVYPIRSILWKRRNIKFVMSNVTKVDLDKQLVAFGEKVVHYDYLILATGSVSNFYGIPGAAEHTFSLKTLEQGVAVRNHIICSFERASNEEDDAKRQRLITFTIIGGGATGVEYAGALAELIHGPLMYDYPDIDFKQVRIFVIEGSGHLLMGMPERAQNYTADKLRSMGVEIKLNAKVDCIEPHTIHLAGGECIATETAIWTAGVRGDWLAEKSGLPVAKDGRVKVTPTLQIPGYPNAYVVGDLAYIEENGKPLPFVAQVAMQSGRMAASNILAQISGQEPQPFSYRDKGMMVTVGRNSAAVRIGKRAFTGFFAWLLWVGLHIFYLIGFRNRIVVLINWAWDYLLYERPVRFVFPSDINLLRKAAQCAYGYEPAQESKGAEEKKGT